MSDRTLTLSDYPCVESGTIGIEESQVVVNNCVVSENVTANLTIYYKGHPVDELAVLEISAPDINFDLNIELHELEKAIEKLKEEV